MNYRLTAFIYLPFLILVTAFFSCNEKSLDCQSIKKGIFYSHYQGSEELYKTIRSDSLQQEINLTKGDTSLWKIKWISDCKYSVQYVSGIQMESKEMEQFYRSATFIATVIKVKPDYYVFSADVTTSKQRLEIRDTVWRKPPPRR